jgi:transcriptional regulator with XRE-family HTH domain
MSTLQIIGQRLRQAREVVGYTQEEVSKKLGITKDELSLFESGKRNPPLSLLRKLAQLYGVFVSYFYGIDKPEGTAFTLLLHKAKEFSLPPETISQVQRFIFLCKEIVQLRQKLGFPKPEIPYYTLNQESIEKQAKEVAEAERARLGLGDSVVPNLGEVLEDIRIPVIRLPLGRELSSAMVYDESFSAFILVNSDEPYQNQLIAYEYAHILQRKDKVYLNRHAKDWQRDDFSERFVVHFLMPESLVKRLVRQHHNITDVWALISLRRTFGVSYETLISRLHELGEIGEKDLNRLLRANLWNLEIKLCGEPSPPVPWKISKVLWELVLTAVKHEFITTSYASDLLEMSPMEIQDILYELKEIELSRS